MPQRDDRSSSRKAKLLSRNHIVDALQRVWAVDKLTGIIVQPPLYNVAGLDPDYQHLLASAPMAFEVIEQTIAFQETMIGYFEANDLERLVGPMLDSQAGLHASQQASLFGLKSLIDRKNKR